MHTGKRERPVANREKARAASFTIVELMVAMALMIILTGIIVYIFGKTREIALYTEAQAQVFQNARYAMDLMGRDIASIIKTIDMEPFEDKEDPNTRIRNGHYDHGERDFHARGGPWEDRYDFSLTIHQGFYDDLQFDDIVHNADSIYMKTIASEKGRPTDAFVTYYLDETQEKRPILKRRFERFDRDKMEMQPDPARVEDVCYFVTDFKVEFYYIDYRNSPTKPRGPGTWLTPLEAQRRGILDPDGDPATFVFNYHYDDRIRERLDLNASGPGKLIVDASKGYQATFVTKQNFPFPQLVPGDKIFIYGQTPKIPPGNQIPWLSDQELTIAEITESTQQILFLERVIIQPTSEQPPPPILNCNYRVAFLPAAFRITLRVKDQRADAIRTIQRVFRVMGG